MDSTMYDTVRINIKYRLKDIREFSISKVYSGVLGEIFLAFSVLSLSFLIISMTIILFLCFSEPYLLLAVFPTYIFILLSICAIEFLPLLIVYSIRKNSFIKSKALQGMNCLDFSRENYKIYSAEGMSNLSWEEVYKIEELRLFFILYLSPLKMTIIPKRCFESQEQIERLKDILKFSMPRNKLKLKKYKFKKFSPDYGEVGFKNESATVEESNETNTDENPELTLEFVPDKRDLLVTNLTMLYTKPVGIIITLIGLLLIISRVKSFEISVSSLAAIFCGIGFVFLIPIRIIIDTSRGYNNDPLLQKTLKFKIYKDYYIIDHPSGMSRTEFVNLVKVDETRSAILLFVTTQIFHIIPKRIFEGKEEDLFKLKEILSKYCKKKS